MTLKEQAKALKKLNPDKRLYEIYEELAKNAGFKSWNHYSAYLKQRGEK